ncbi:peptide deformylase [Dissulfuribacter thermophilus]|uniref:peptide deformylase n=1 Tax=Dissulfuribacter thermophilus TaxID=1156395 RepID=UPI00082EB5F3|nr:peptide deformylase [Dissulfuribacter thermophilus]
MKILVYPHEILRQVAEPVKNIDGALQAFIDDMIKTMYKAEGVGLAANQVGRPIELVVMDCATDDERGKNPIVLINPRIIEQEGEMVGEEGCLSIPGYGAKVRRSEVVLVKAYDRDGKEIEIEARGGLLSKCIQHEIDHLKGICFVDRLSPVKKALFKKRWAKIRPKDE